SRCSTRHRGCSASRSNLRPADCERASFWTNCPGRDVNMGIVAKARKIRGLEYDMPFAEAAGLTIATRAGEVFAYADGVLDTADIERVHDMRVATRRLRAVLEIYAPCFPRRRYEAVLGEVKQLADALGERRDPDVHIDAMTHFAEGFAAADRAGV